MTDRNAPPIATQRREILRPLRLFGLFFRIGALNELQYRANFAVQVFQSVIALGTGLAVLGLVFSQTTSLNDWTQPELLAVMGVHILMGGVIRTVIQPNMERLMTDVREGTLDFVLTKPEDSQVLISVREVKIWQAVDIIVGFVVLAIGVSQIEASVGPVQAIAFAVTVPAEAITSRLTPETLAVAAGFALALLVFTRWWWRFGLRRYSGASA